MSYRIINFPKPVARAAYEIAIGEMLERLKQNTDIVSVYSIGSVGSPGISDIDMVVVTKDNATIETNYLAQLSPDERYLFTHNLYAISRSHFETAGRFTFFHNYILNFGEEFRLPSVLSGAETDQVKKQIALEFIVKMYVNTTLQEKYKVLRMRDILLHVKALMYDFEFLNIPGHPFVKRIHTIIDWRKNWFTNRPNDDEIIRWWKLFNVELSAFTKEVLKDYDFFLPLKSAFRISKNTVLRPKLSCPPEINYTGLVLPNTFSFIGKKFFRIQNRINSFEFKIPATQSELPLVISQKFDFEQELTSYGRKFLPHFLPLTSSLHLH